MKAASMRIVGAARDRVLAQGDGLVLAAQIELGLGRDQPLAPSMFAPPGMGKNWRTWPPA